MDADRSSLERAMEEFRNSDEKEFYKKHTHGFPPKTEYFVEDGHIYPVKAIFSAAQQPPKHTDLTTDGTKTGLKKLGIVAFRSFNREIGSSTRIDGSQGEAVKAPNVRISESVGIAASGSPEAFTPRGSFDVSAAAEELRQQAEEGARIVREVETLKRHSGIVASCGASTGCPRIERGD